MWALVAVLAVPVVELMVFPLVVDIVYWTPPARRSPVTVATVCPPVSMVHDHCPRMLCAVRVIVCADVRVFAASSLSSLLPVAASVVVADRGSVCTDMPNAAARSTASTANVAAMMRLVLLCMVGRFRPLLTCQFPCDYTMLVAVRVGCVLLWWCWRGARAAEASSVENCSTARCPGFKSLSRRRSYCACVVKPRRVLLLSMCPAGLLCTPWLSAACELGEARADALPHAGCGLRAFGLCSRERQDCDGVPVVVNARGVRGGVDCFT